MAFKSTTNRSHLRLVREIEAIGGNVAASASREVTAYTFDALKTYLPQMVEVLVDCVRNPAFLDWEVKDEVAFLYYFILTCHVISLYSLHYSQPFLDMRNLVFIIIHHSCKS